MNAQNSPRLDDRREGAPLSERKLSRNLLVILSVLVLGALGAGLIAMRMQGPPVKTHEQATAAVNTDPSSPRNVEDLLPPSLTDKLARSASPALPAGAAPMPKFGSAIPGSTPAMPVPEKIEIGAPLHGQNAPAIALPTSLQKSPRSATIDDGDGQANSGGREDSLLVFAFTDRDAKATSSRSASGNPIVDMLQGELGKLGTIPPGSNTGISPTDIAGLLSKFTPTTAGPARASDPAKLQSDFNARLASEKPADLPLKAVAGDSPDLPRIWQGSLIPAVMKTSIDTEQSGQVVAQVSRDVYDSQTQRIKLVPKGSELVGQYSSSFVDGQNRVLLAFTRLRLPDGRRIELGAMNGADSIGRTGVAADVDQRFGRRFASAALTAVMGIAADRLSTRTQPNSTTINVGASAGSATSQAIGEASRNFLSREMSIGAIGRVEVGADLRLMVNRDIELSPWDLR